MYAIYVRMYIDSEGEEETFRLTPLVTSSEGSDEVDGIVEVLYNRRWGYICRPPDTELNNVAEAACEGFGYQRESSRVLGTPRRR